MSDGYAMKSSSPIIFMEEGKYYRVKWNTGVEEEVLCFKVYNGTAVSLQYEDGSSYADYTSSMDEAEEIEPWEE